MMDMNAFRALSYGMYAIMVDDNGSPTGCIVNTVFQITAENPIVAVSVSKANYTHDLIVKTGKYGISILSEKTTPDCISSLGFFSGKDKNKNKMENLRFHLVDGVALLDENCVAGLICEVVSVSEAETHSVFLGRVVQTEIQNSFAPMTYKYYHEVVKGSSPKNAPTYQAPVASDKQKYVCDVCNYVYEGDITKEPDEYLCPICKKDKTHFHAVEEVSEKYVCKVCNYIYEGDITKESDEYLCPICKKDKTHFQKI